MHQRALVPPVDNEPAGSSNHAVRSVQPLNAGHRGNDLGNFFIYYIWIERSSWIIDWENVEVGQLALLLVREGDSENKRRVTLLD